MAWWQGEALATHAPCALCHRKADPLGFAFEHYDAVGQWRTEKRVTTGKAGNYKLRGVMKQLVMSELF